MKAVKKTLLLYLCFQWLPNLDSTWNKGITFARRLCVQCGLTCINTYDEPCSSADSEESRAVLRGRHQQDKCCYSNVSRSGVYGWKPTEGCSLRTDRLRNGRSFCYLFLKLSLKPLFITAPEDSCMDSHLPSRWVSRVQGTGPGSPWCSATNEAHKCEWRVTFTRKVCSALLLTHKNEGVQQYSILPELNFG